MKRIKNAMIDFAGIFGITCLVCFLFTGNLMLPVYAIISLTLGKVLYEDELTPTNKIEKK